MHPPANIDINRTPSTRIFFFDSCMKWNDAEQIVLNMHFFFTFSRWFALLPINSCLENLYRLGHGINSTGYELSKVVDMKESTKHPPPLPNVLHYLTNLDTFFNTNHEWRMLHRTEYELTNNRTRTILHTMYQDSIEELKNCIYIYKRITHLEKHKYIVIQNIEPVDFP